MSKKELVQLDREEQIEIEEKYQEEFSSYKKESSARKADWENVKKQSFETWKNTKLPTWLDHTYQAKENTFTFPYFEGGESIGFALVLFKNGFKPQEIQKFLMSKNFKIIPDSQIAGTESFINLKYEKELPNISFRVKS